MNRTEDHAGENNADAGRVDGVSGGAVAGRDHGGSGDAGSGRRAAGGAADGVDRQWAWWKTALAGKINPMRESDPESGFYRARNGDPVAFWKAHGKQHCLRAGSAIVGAGDAMSLWVAVAKSPVTKAAYDARRTDGAWPDAPAASIGHNLPSDPYLNLQARINDKLEAARAFLRAVAGKQPDQTTADKARNIKSDIEALTREAKAWKETEKRPILDAGYAIEAKFNALAEPMTKAGPVLVAVYDAFLKAETAKREAEARAKFEAERRAAEIARQEMEAARARRMKDDPIAALTSVEPELPPMPTAPEPVKVSVGGLTGTKASLRTTRTLVITDWRAAVAHYAGTAEVCALVEKLARADHKDGKLHPFFKIEKGETA